MYDMTTLLIADGTLLLAGISVRYEWSQYLTYILSILSLAIHPSPSPHNSKGKKQKIIPLFYFNLYEKDEILVILTFYLEILCY